eukprot:scaffold16712_cov65-Phaeocystis_antarctica.AAC.24
MGETRRTAHLPAERKVATRPSASRRLLPCLQRASSVPGGRRPGPEHGTRAGRGGRAAWHVAGSGPYAWPRPRPAVRASAPLAPRAARWRT